MNAGRRVATGVRDEFGELGVRTPAIELRRLWANGDVERPNGKLRDELLDRMLFFALTEARILIERWRCHDDTERSRSCLDSRTRLPAPRPSLLARVLLESS
jgi:putative transposase